MPRFLDVGIHRKHYFAIIGLEKLQSIFKCNTYEQRSIKFDHLSKHLSEDRYTMNSTEVVYISERIK